MQICVGWGMLVMETETETCSAFTAGGRRCLRPPRKSGLCSVHERKLKPDPTQERYQKVIKTVLTSCRVKGWEALVSNKDKDCHFAIIEVCKRFGVQEVTGQLHITVSADIRYSIERTSFYGYGLKDLLDTISFKFGELGWHEKADAKAERKQPDGNDPIKQQEFNISRIIKHVLRNFDKVTRQLRRRHEGRSPYQIADEYDVQDLLHAILLAYFEDVRPEEYTPSYAGTASRIDFLLKAEKAAIEVKFANAKLRDKHIGEQLIIDIAKYQAHPDCSTLYCLVYDPDRNIANPSGLEHDLSSMHGRIAVTVIVVPN